MNSNKRQRHENHKEEINSNKRQHHENHKEEINSNRRQRHKDCYAKNCANEFKSKGDFNTTTNQIPCDTTEYEIALSPETAVINWYMCTGTWRLQWLMEDIQDLLKEDGKSDTQIAFDKERAQDLIQTLKSRISNEIVSPEKCKKIADSFYKAMGKGCFWGTKQSYAEKSIDANSIDAMLLGCAACGRKEYHDIGEEDNRHKFEFMGLSNNKLCIFKLDEEATKKYEDQMKVKLDLPVNNNGRLKQFQPWLTRSIYCYINPDSPDQKTYYYFHLEMIIEKNNVPITAVLCPDCASQVNNGHIPTNSIADGVDSGVPDRIGLVPLTARELYIIAKVRHYINMIKVESNSRTLKEHQQCALKGCTILFEHDAPQVIADLLSPKSMNDGIFLHLVGHKGEFDALYKKMMHSKTANVFGRKWALFQWLSVLQTTNPIYHNLGLHSFRKFKNIVDKATDVFISTALKTFDDNIMKETSQMKDMQVNHEGVNQPQDDELHSDDQSTDFAMKFCLLADQTSSAHKSTVDSSHTYFKNVAKPWE